MDKDQLIIILLIAMAIALAAELVYIFIKKKRRKEEMSLFKKRETAEEPLADKAHNTVLTAESISQNLARQGADTAEANGLIAEARREMAMRDYARAIERAEAAKISLLRAKRDMASEPQGAGLMLECPDSDDDAEEITPPKNIEKKQDALPTNYMQAKFMLSTTKDLLEKKGITGGEAYDLYRNGAALFEKGDFTKALSCAIKAERLLDSETMTLIGEARPAQAAEEVLEVMVCPACEKEVSDDDAFCKECGQNLAAASKCPGCGNDIGPSDKFCRKCGTKLTH